MKRIKRFLKSPAATMISFFLAVGLLLFSTIGGARAALTYFSDTYVSRVQTSNIGVTLLENGREIAKRDYNETSDGTWDESTGVLLANLLAKDEKFAVGKKYKEELSVKNSGTIDQYVRVSVFRYWLKDEKKDRTLSPELIGLNLVNVGGDWLLDETSTTEERIVLYYSKLLKAGETSSLFADSIKIDNMIATKVTQVPVEGKKNTIRTVYDYDGMQFCVEAKVDAVQNHNAEDAIWSAWGKRVTVDNDTLKLR
ncbi:MAG: hypothetical protein HFH01_11615 [Dorea sp.]|nr:hypothetical protein [Dorea sp.]